MNHSRLNLKDKKDFLKMKELSEVTGVTSGTIRYYIQQGLLPQPYKPHKNMAYYDPVFVDQIFLIKNLQEKHYLPLDVIKMMLDDNIYDIERAKKWLDQSGTISWFELEENENNPSKMTKEQLVEHSGLDVCDIETATEYNMLSMDENGYYDYESIKLAVLASEFRKMGLTTERGFTIEFLVLHYELFEFLVKKEVDIFAKNILNNDISFEEIHDVSEKALEIFYELGPIIHRRFLRNFLEEIRGKNHHNT